MSGKTASGAGRTPGDRSSAWQPRSITLQADTMMRSLVRRATGAPGI